MIKLPKPSLKKLEAYEVLSDSQKRAQYDQFGHVSNDAGGFGGFSGGFSDFDFEIYLRHFWKLHVWRKNQNQKRSSKGC